MAYKVIALTQSGNTQRVEIYDLHLNSWSTTGHLPHNWIWRIWRERIVISENMFYYHVVDLNFLRCDIVGFNVQKETSIFMPLSLEDVDDSDSYDFLFTCGSRVFLDTFLRDVDFSKISNFIIWEFEKPKLGSNYSWREIARIPSSFLKM
jgi:hypothetical protein